MKFSLFYLPGFDREVHGHASTLYKQMIEQVVLGEAIGLEKVWVAEHHQREYGGDVPCSPVLLASLAQHTSRIKLCTGGIAVPLHRPLEAAEQLAMLDCLSDGRLEMGMVRGFLNYEYDAYNISMDESRARFVEGVEIIRGLFANERFSYRGTFSSFEDIELRPRPVQTHPRVSIATVASPETLEYAAEHGFDLGVVPYATSMQKTADMIQRYRELLTAAGHDPDERNVMAQFFYYGHSDPAVAKETPREPILAYLRRFLAALQGRRASKDYVGYEHMASAIEGMMEYEGFYEELSMFGHPDRFHERVREAEAMGITEIALMPTLPALPHNKVLETLEFLGKELLPVWQ